MKKRKIFSYPIDKDNPLYVVCELHNPENLYAVGQNDFLSAYVKSDVPIECIMFEIMEGEDYISYSIKEPRETVQIERGYLAGIFLH
ncbi:hypothetical protein [Flagellimonas sp. 2504JD1-5]